MSAPLQARANEDAARGGVAPSGLVVLLADDDDDMRELICAMLRSDGHEVHEARDGAALLTLLSKYLDDPARRALVVVSDVRMPNLSGLGALAAAHSAHWPVPFVLITVMRDASVGTVAQRLGAVAVLKKPVDFDDLRTAVMNARAAFRRRTPGS